MVTQKIVVPDFGDVQEITVVEIYIQPGDKVEIESPLIALESEKAVMDIPSPFEGTITEILMQDNQSVKSGDLIAVIEMESSETQGEEVETREQIDQEKPATPKPAKEAVSKKTEPEPVQSVAGTSHATPSVRAYARELEIDLSTISGSGPKGRITKEDVVGFVKTALKQPQQPAGVTLEEPPLEDFSVYGEIEELELGRIKKIAGPHLQRSWATIPHVTQFDEADVTELESFRQQLNKEEGESGIKFSQLVFIIKAVAATLKEFPLFNCSLVPGGKSIIQKHYYNIGIAVDTPNGLVVPVIKNADSKGMREVAAELKSLSEAAREGKLAIPDIQGASFTISSLGGIGGTGFTPIVNGPQVAILGLSRNFMKPVWDGEQFLPRLTLPFSVSYDHRVIDGADGARFCKALKSDIEDLRRALL